MRDMGAIPRAWEGKMSSITICEDHGVVRGLVKVKVATQIIFLRLKIGVIFPIAVLILVRETRVNKLAWPPLLLPSLGWCGYPYLQIPWERKKKFPQF